MRLLIRDGDDLIETKTFETQTITIGSGPDCDVRIPDRRLLPQQVFIRPQQDGTWVVENADGGSPVVLNGRPLTRPTPIKNADDIGINNYTIAVYRSKNEKFQEPPAKQVALPEEAAKLRAHPMPPGSVTKAAGQGLCLDGSVPARLAEFSMGLRDRLDIPDLMDYAVNTLLQEFGGRMAYAGTRKKNYGSLEWVHGRDDQGRNVGEPPAWETYLYRCLDHEQFLCIPKVDDPQIESALVAPLTCGRGQLGILYVDRKKGVQPFKENDLDLFILLAALTAAQLEKIILNQLQVQQAATEGQQSFLREIQCRMDPAKVPQWDGLQLAIYCKPGQDHAGDIYDVMRLGNGLATIFVASLSGETIRCGLAMTEIRAAFRMAGLHADAPNTFLRSVNWMLCEDRTPCHMSIAVVAMNPLTGELQHSTAGRIGAIILDQHGDSRDLADRNAPAAGSTPNFPYDSRFDRLGPDHTLALFTPGSWTVADSSGQPLGEDRLVDSIRDGFGQSASVALDELVQDHECFFKQGRQPDDMTILLFHRVALPG